MGLHKMSTFLCTLAIGTSVFTGYQFFHSQGQVKQPGLRIAEASLVNEEALADLYEFSYIKMKEDLKIKELALAMRDEAPKEEQQSSKDEQQNWKELVAQASDYHPDFYPAQKDEAAEQNQQNLVAQAEPVQERVDNRPVMPVERYNMPPQNYVEPQWAEQWAGPDFNSDDFYCCHTFRQPRMCECPAWFSPVRLTLGHTEGDWLSVDEGYTTLGLFNSFLINRCGNLVLVSDTKGHVFNNGRKAANRGNGLRYYDAARNSIYGAHVYYDYRHGFHFGNYDQVGASFEWLTPCFDARLNAYFPVGQRTHHSDPHFFHNFSNKKLCARRVEKQSALTGFDVELGRWLKTMDCCNCSDLYFAIGGHFYDGHHHRDRYGVEGRLLSHWGNYVTLELGAGYDRISKGMVQGTITFSLPLENFCTGILERWLGWDRCNACPLPCSVFQPVHRRDIITLSKRHCSWNWKRDSSRR